MKLFNQICFDVKNGILARWKLYVFVLCVSIILSIAFFHDKELLIENRKMGGGISFADALLYIFRGMKEYHPEYRKAFDLTDSFLIWNLILAYIIGDYPVRELRNTGKNHLIRSKKRKIWWFGKCFWNTASVLVFYGSIITGIFIVSIRNNGAEMSVNRELFFRIFQTELAMGTETYLIVQVFFLPVISSIAISMLQMTMTLIWNEAIGYICTITICGLSAYYMRWFLPGNGTMVYRYAAVNSNGIGIFLPAITCAVIIIVSCLVGFVYFENKDIL